MNKWLFNEFRHCGVDYSDAAAVSRYDKEHQKFRNFDRELAELLDKLALPHPETMTLIDLGCGTGAFSVAAAGHFKKIYAVDVSDAMLDCARDKIRERDIGNVEFVSGGFLTYEYRHEPADMVVSKAALHHLPDFWKQIALLRINEMLKMDGIFYLFDIVFHFPPAVYEERIKSWIAGFESIAGGKFAAEVETHIRDEYSTFDWVMKEMLERAGFAIDRIDSPDGMQTEYFCRKCDIAMEKKLV
ncbi:MAG: class I SAM-dependent methyltransferase [Victivallales bacterium]|nr:class I SAM-dependent methyltransferase [Victivallales bacterium]